MMLRNLYTPLGEGFGGWRLGLSGAFKGFRESYVQIYP